MKPNLPQKSEKPWSFELLFSHTTAYAGKLILINAGHRLSLQYHDRKDESMYIYSGKVLIEIGESDGKLDSFTLHPGDAIRVPAGVRHRMKAIEDTTIFEVSTPELNDVIRIEDDYGRDGR